MTHQPFEYYIIVDVEANCERENPDFLREIIELPLVLVQVNKRDPRKSQIVDKKQIYVRPTVNPKITPFCRGLTGIEQESVDNADTLESVLQTVHKFLQSNDLIEGEYQEWLLSENLDERSIRKKLSGIKFAFATDGPWDIRDFLSKECIMKRIPMPYYFYQWVDIRSSFADFYKTRNGGIRKMLAHHAWTFEGNEHSGIDDSLNIARICIKLIQDGCILKVNDSMLNYKNAMKRRESRVRKETPQENEHKQPVRYLMVLHFRTTHSNVNEIEAVVQIEEQIIEIESVLLDCQTLHVVCDKNTILVKPDISVTLDKVPIDSEALTNYFGKHLTEGVELSVAVSELRKWKEMALRSTMTTSEPVESLNTNTCVAIRSRQLFEFLRSKFKGKKNFSMPNIFSKYVTVEDLTNNIECNSIDEYVKRIQSFIQLGGILRVNSK